MMKALVVWVVFNVLVIVAACCAVAAVFSTHHWSARVTFVLAALFFIYFAEVVRRIGNRMDQDE